MSTSTPHPDVVCNTTPLRYFGAIGQADLLAEALGGTIRVPREVLDPEEDEDAPGSLLSEIGRSQRKLLRRPDGPEDFGRGQRLRALRNRSDLEVIDLTAAERDRKLGFRSWGTVREHDLDGPLGEGEAAVMAVAEARGCSVAMDDYAARRVLAQVAPQVRIMTSRELLISAVTELGALDSGQAQIVYMDMLEAGYSGPPELWGS